LSGVDFSLLCYFFVAPRQFVAALTIGDNALAKSSSAMHWTLAPLHRICAAGELSRKIEFFT
jgi:hypothetical protein